MFTCVRCKNEFEGLPALKNGAGEFCLSCKTLILDRMRLSVKARQDKTRGVCLWCGGISNEKNTTSGYDEHVCRTCETMRARLLKCIRYSNRVAKYVARVEEKESVVRLAREQELQRLKEIEDKKIDALPTEVELRVKRMEELLTKLVTELGVS